jgi:uncharacterized protein (TIGR00730 family)
MSDPHDPRKRTSPLPPVETTRELVRVIDQSVEQLWSTIESLERLQPRNLERFRVSIFGSSRTRPDHALYSEARELARRLAAAGCEIVTGGGAGLMQAANEGASQGEITEPADGDGLPIRMVAGSEVGPFVERVYRHRTFFSRLHHFVRLSSAFVVFPGGLGSTLEATMVWQLLQVRHLPPTPFLLYGQHWDGLMAWIRDTVVADGFADRLDLCLPLRIDTVDAAERLILSELERFGTKSPRRTR